MYVCAYGGMCSKRIAYVTLALGFRSDPRTDDSNEHPQHFYEEISQIISLLS